MFDFYIEIKKFQKKEHVVQLFILKENRYKFAMEILLNRINRNTIKISVNNLESLGLEVPDIVLKFLNKCEYEDGYLTIDKGRITIIEPVENVI